MTPISGGPPSSGSPVLDPQRSRLTPERESEILAVALELLEDVGYQGLTMPAVAQRARCSTATIYRRWGGRSGLVLAALRADRPHPAAEPDTGSLRGDLVAMVEELAQVAESQIALMAALVHASIRDEDLAAAMRAELSTPAGAPFDRILDRAVARGEIELTPDVRRYCHHVMLTSTMAAHMVEGARPDRDYLVGFVDAVLIPTLFAGRR